MKQLMSLSGTSKQTTDSHHLQPSRLGPSRYGSTLNLHAKRDSQIHQASIRQDEFTPKADDSKGSKKSPTKQQSFMQYLQSIQEEQKKTGDNSDGQEEGMSKENIHNMRDKVHKYQIKDTYDEKREDMNQMIKEYNMRKNIFDQEEIKDKQSIAQRRNIIKVLSTKNY